MKVANSRGPESIPSYVLASGGRAVHADEVVPDVDALILLDPLSHLSSTCRCLIILSLRALADLLFPTSKSNSGGYRRGAGRSCGVAARRALTGH